MRLSSIKLAGFKSFVDASVLLLPSNLTAIVGPNGCGKSNIIDAVRWVLGESSMKQLRSDTMEDVIFNGSKTRKPAGRASIELTFDNQDGTVQGPYSSYAEIMVRREISRDGNSQYYLNGAKCLKRDVTDLFLGTGLGARTGYAIIEQGMVSNMIQAKPDELRVWLEEAAGISKYKERRRETESRIKQTRENLARLNDLRVELQTRLEVLTKQATNAEKYKEFKEQERKLKAEHLALRLRSLSDQHTSQEAALAELTRSLDAARTRLAQAHEAQGLSETANRDSNHALSNQQNKVYEAESQLARQEQNLQHAKEHKAIKTRDLEQIGLQLQDLGQRESAEQARLAELTRSLNDLQAQAEAAETEEAKAQTGLNAAEQAVQSEQTRWDEFSQRAETPLFQAEGQRVRVQALELALSQAAERIQRLDSEHTVLDAKPLQSSLFDADAELATLTRELSEGQSRLQAVDQQIQELRDARAKEEGALHETRQTLQGARGRLASLETLQQAALRQDDAELQAWLREQGLGNVPRLASALKVERGWESAVEHVLQGLLQAPLLPEFSQRVANLKKPQKTGVTVVDNSGDAGHGPADRLAAKLQGPAVIAELLLNIYVAPTHAEAMYRLNQLKPGESVIEPDGTWRGRGWVRYPQSEKDHAEVGVLARGLLLSDLRTEVETQTQAVRQHEQTLELLQSRLTAVETERRERSSQFDSGRGRQAQRLAFRQTQAVRLEQTQSRCASLQQELDALRAAHAQQTQEITETRQRLTGLESVAQQLRAERGSLQQTLAQRREDLQKARAELSRVQSVRNQAQVQLAGRNSALEALRQVLADLVSRTTYLAAQRETQQREALALDAPIEAQLGGLDPVRAAVEREREALRLAREKVEAAEARVSDCVRLSRESEFAQDAARDKLQLAQIEFQGLSVRRQTLSDQIVEAGFNIDELLPTLDASGTPEAWEEKLTAMTRRIERLGPINLAAIQELEEGQTREKYLGDQNNDLVGALETLESAIRKIDAETQERFKVTFERVNTIFKERFPKLFGGGEAYLELTGDDLLETGVRVMARPPGKRNSSIQLLSGGEKAMTAVALLLALFELNPAPFCMLDEVDAPLDDANVGRFVDVIREMSGNVQFIIITHNKLSMELAEQLHGVTMQEPGVSRLVSVDIQQAVDLAAKRETAEAVA